MDVRNADPVHAYFNTNLNICYIEFFRCVILPDRWLVVLTFRVETRFDKQDKQRRSRCRTTSSYRLLVCHQELPEQLREIETSY